MTFQTIGRHSARAGRKCRARRPARRSLRGLRRLGDRAAPDVPVPPPARAVDLPGRGTTHVLDLPGPTPDAPVLLLMHGIATTGPLTWFTVLDELRAAYRVVTFDQRWHGRGIRSAEFTLDDCADDAVAVLDALGIERAVVVGYSMGGASAQVLWHRHPERVAGLVLCSTVGALGGPHGRTRVLPDAADRQRGTALGRRGQGAAHADAVPPPAEDAAEAGLRAWCMSELRSTSLWSLPVVMAELGKFDATAWIGDVARADRRPGHRQRQGDPDRAAAAAGRPDPRRDHAVAPGGHTSLVFDLAHWKPVFLELVDDVVDGRSASRERGQPVIDRAARRPLRTAPSIVPECGTGGVLAGQDQRSDRSLQQRGRVGGAAGEHVGVAAAGPRVGLPVGEQRLVGDQVEVRPERCELAEPGRRPVGDLQRVPRRPALRRSTTPPGPRRRPAGSSEFHAHHA